MIVTRKIDEITFDQNLMFLHAQGQIYRIDLDSVSQKLKLADDFQRNLYKISPSGYGIHWPLIDEDLAIDSLLKVAS